MRKLTVLLLLAFFTVATVNAQDGKQLMKDAKKALTTYKIKPEDNPGALKEAADAATRATKTSEFKNDTEAWALKGEVYATMAAENTKNVTTGGQIVYPDAGVTSFKAYKEALNLAEKNRDIKTALKGITDLAGHLSSTGNYYINSANYAAAYPSLNAVYEADKVLVANDQNSIFNSEEDKESHLYAVAVCALEAGKTDVAKNIYMQLYENNTQQVGVYASLFRLLINEDEAKALEILEKGKQVDPESPDLLYAEINYLIGKKDYATLEVKLKEAIAKNPDNPSIYLALGNVYSQLASSATDQESLDNYNAQAMEYFEKVLELDPKSFDALYSIGSIYFNEGASITQQMGELGLSKEDQEKYEAMDAQVKGLFEQALPYFKRSEQINPGDRNTLIALKEIYARMNDFETSNAFKDRLERVESGETITDSYFD